MVVVIRVVTIRTVCVWFASRDIQVGEWLTVPPSDEDE